MLEGYLFAFGSAIFSAFAAILEKKILFKDKALSFSFLLGFFNFIISIPFFFFIDYHSLTLISLFVLFFKSFLGAISFVCVMLAIKDLEISKALPMLILTPGLVAVFAFLILGDVLSFFEIIGILFLLIGTYVLQLGGKLDFLTPVKKLFSSKGNKYIFIALFLFTTTSILDKALLSKFKIQVNAFFAFQHLFLAIIFLVIVLVSKDYSEIKKTIKYSWRAIFILSFITLSYRYLQILAVKLIPVALVLSIKRLSVFFAIIIGGRIFKDKNLFIRILATIVMLIGAILIIVL